jgi:hypothetical protein
VGGAALLVAAAAVGALIGSRAVPAQDPVDPSYDSGFDIRVEPAGAQVAVDGLDLGRAPLRVGRLAAGNHLVEVSPPPGYLGQRVEVTLRSGQREALDIVLDPVPEPVPAEPVPAEPIAVPVPAEVLAAGSGRGKAGAVASQKPVRSRRAEIARHEPSRRSETSAGPARAATLMVGSKPPCQIILDGRDTGLVTPQRDLKVAPGRHTVTLISRDHGLRKTVRVEVAPGEKKRVIEDLSADLR